MDRRLEFQELLESICSTVYFQAPPNNEMVYPCILYKRDGADTRFADNAPYRRTTRYQVTIISDDPDNGLREAVASLPTSSFNRFFTANNLNHDVYNVYF